MCASVENALTGQLDSLSTISMNIVYSNAIKSNFKEFSERYPQDDNPALMVASRANTNAIHDIITAMIGAYQTASQIKLYTMDGSYVESGYWQRSGSEELAEISWFEEVMALSGHKYITLPTVHKDLPAKGGNQKHRRFISLIRTFLAPDGSPEGIVEVVQDCDTIFSLISQLESQNPEILTYVYNERNELVYPYDLEVPPEDYYSVMAKSGLTDGRSAFLTTAGGSVFLASGKTLPEYGWTVLLMKPKAAVYAPLGNFRQLFSMIGVCSILVTMLICFYISEHLTRPLQKLTVATGKITLDRVLDENKVNLTSADSSITELSQLCESIRSMYEELRLTSQEVLLSKSEETRAKLQATQSLVNPHFLYNCLTNLSVMAEENMNDNIIAMCQALCDYFRYISSSREMMVPLEEELFYTQRYLECMQLRYCDELSYRIDQAEDSKQIAIPKLIIQPLVENAFKYAFNTSPPWTLTITSEVSNLCWNLKITDNGGQLSEKKKEELEQLFEHLDLNEELHSMQIGGMGLKNVYLRLKLLYGEMAVFQIETVPGQSTTFILGGPIRQDDKQGGIL